jgi:hypothetical protein
MELPGPLPKTSMSNQVRRSAIHRAAEELQAAHPGTVIEDGVASFLGGSIAVDLAARLIYCKELGVIEIINPFTEKREIVAKVKGLISRLEERESAVQRKLY